MCCWRAEALRHMHMKNNKHYDTHMIDASGAAGGGPEATTDCCGRAQALPHIPPICEAMRCTNIMPRGSFDQTDTGVCMH